LKKIKVHVYDTSMKRFIAISFVFMVCLPAVVGFAPCVQAQDSDAWSGQPFEPPVLVRAEMCEAIERFLPVNQAVVFSISLGRVYCFTAFDPVHEETVIYHRWYRQDRLISNARLVLNPPKWGSFSSIQLRSADKGPWRVEIVDNLENLIKTLRFSISD
jgi:hypothetical protein